MGHETSYYKMKKGTKISQKCHSVKLRVKRNVQADLPRHYATESQHKLWIKMGRNRNVIPDFAGDGSGNLQLMTAHDCLVAHLYRLSVYPSPLCVLCIDDKAIMNQDIFPIAQL
jgi:hypothetical protein